MFFVYTGRSSHDHQPVCLRSVVSIGIMMTNLGTFPCLVTGHVVIPANNSRGCVNSSIDKTSLALGIVAST